MGNQNTPLVPLLSSYLGVISVLFTWESREKSDDGFLVGLAWTLCALNIIQGRCKWRICRSLNDVPWERQTSWTSYQEFKQKVKTWGFISRLGLYGFPPPPALAPGVFLLPWQFRPIAPHCLRLRSSKWLELQQRILGLLSRHSSDIGCSLRNKHPVLFMYSYLNLMEISQRAERELQQGLQIQRESKGCGEAVVLFGNSLLWYKEALVCPTAEFL